jgi:hypothetical protein
VTMIIKRIRILGLFTIPIFSSSITLYDGPTPGDHIIHDAFYSASLLNKRIEYANILSTTQLATPRVFLRGDLQSVITQAKCFPRGMINAHLFLPWITGSVCLEYEESPIEPIPIVFPNVVLGDLRQFPLYFQCGIYPLPWSRQTSEMFVAQNLFTQQVINEHWMGGGTLGLYYHFNPQHTLKIATSLGEMQGLIIGGNIQYQLNLVDQGLAFIVGASMHHSCDFMHPHSVNKPNTEHSEAMFKGYDIYLETYFSSLKLKIEKSQAHWAIPKDASAFHGELSYHCSSYYFHYPSALIVGYEKIDITSTHWTIENLSSQRGFGGFKTQCFKHWNLILGGQWDIPKPSVRPLVILDISF